LDGLVSKARFYGLFYFVLNGKGLNFFYFTLDEYIKTQSSSVVINAFAKNENVMKNILTLILACALSITAFSQKTTIIIVRHAEKDTAKGQGNDPALSAAGTMRAENLVTLLKDYKPDIIYSTNYIRTKSTVSPLAAKNNITVQLYDPANLPGFANDLKQQKGKTIIVCGHSNTNPQLANLLAGNSNFKQMDDNVYNRIFTITIENGIATAFEKDY